MRAIRLYLVHLSPASRPAARAAARKAFPRAELVERGTVEEAGRAGGAGRAELLVLGEPDAAAVARAIQAVDANGIPRWAVVLLGGDLADLAETVPPEEWQPALLARVFRSALVQHELWRENLRLQGDLKTVARRIHHDLWTPLGCIATSSHVLKLGLTPAVLRPVAGMLEAIEESSGEISQLIDRVSFVLRASADPGIPGRIEMGAVVANVLRQLEPEIKKAGATVAEPAAWPGANGVAPWLQVIWWNLLQNALRHSGPSAQVELAWTPEEDHHRFSVANHGPVLDAGIRARLFRPFDQLHLQAASGLGLAIVQRLVALQGGCCGYERRGDGASVFFFTLPGGEPAPRRQAATRRRRQASEVKPVGGGR